MSSSKTEERARLLAAAVSSGSSPESIVAAAKSHQITVNELLEWMEYYGTLDRAMEKQRDAAQTRAEEQHSGVNALLHKILE